MNRGILIAIFLSLLSVSLGRLCPSGKVWSPSPKTTFHIQYTGTINYSRNVQVYNIDMFDAVTTSVVNNLKNRGIAVMCYFSSQYENWRIDAKNFTSAIKGNDLDGWEGENWVDIRATKLRDIMKWRMDLAVKKGCDAIDVDNVDGYTHTNGFGLTAANQLNFNQFLATEAHKRGLSIGLKNDVGQIAQLVSYFDFAVNEECNDYNECNKVEPFITNGKAVFGIEYNPDLPSNTCSKMNTKKFSTTFKSYDLDYAFDDCCASAAGGCQNTAAYQCVQYPA